MGLNHLRVLSILKEVEVAFVFDYDCKTLAEISKKYSVNASSCSKLENDLRKVDGVIICTPTSTHAEYVISCSKYVKNIFVEKPLASNLKETIKLHEFIKEKN